MSDDPARFTEVERQSVLRMLETALQLAREAQTVCNLWDGDKSADALRAALSAFQDAYDAWVHQS
jgi:hypothetical protein